MIREALAARRGPRRTRSTTSRRTGPGPALGDPIEVAALAAVLGRGTASGPPLLVGSVKTNIGHLEAAAGIAGLIKTLLCLSNGEIPRLLHFQTPNREIPWDELPVAPVTRNSPWPARSGGGSPGSAHSA